MSLFCEKLLAPSVRVTRGAINTKEHSSRLFEFLAFNDSASHRAIGGKLGVLRDQFHRIDSPPDGRTKDTDSELTRMTAVVFHF